MPLPSHLVSHQCNHVCNEPRCCYNAIPPLLLCHVDEDRGAAKRTSEGQLQQTAESLRQVLATIPWLPFIGSATRSLLHRRRLELKAQPLAAAAPNAAAPQQAREGSEERKEETMAQESKTHETMEAEAKQPLYPDESITKSSQFALREWPGTSACDTVASNPNRATIHLQHPGTLLQSHLQLLNTPEYAMQPLDAIPTVEETHGAQGYCTLGGPIIPTCGITGHLDFMFIDYCVAHEAVYGALGGKASAPLPRSLVTAMELLCRG